MADLYFEGEITKAFEAGRKAANLAIAGTLDVHMRDAAIKTIGEVHVLVSGHEDSGSEVKAAAELPDCSTEESGKYLLKAIDDAEAECNKPANANAAVAGLDPGTLILLKVIAGWAWKLLKDYFN